MIRYVEYASVAALPDEVFDWCVRELVHYSGSTMSREAYRMRETGWPGLVIVAMDEAEPIGWILRDRSGLLMMFVAPDHRRQGHATRMARIAVAADERVTGYELEQYVCAVMDKARHLVRASTPCPQGAL